MMANSVNIMAGRLAGQQQKLTATADNVANVNSAGFKRLVTDFSEVQPVKNGVKVGSFVTKGHTTVDYSVGALTKTDNPFSVAIHGQGFFALDNNGTTIYTRDGNFALDAEGNLVSQSGLPVLDTNGAPLTVPADAREIKISSDGTVSSEQGQLGNIGINIFSKEDLPALRRAGNLGFVAGPNATPIIAEAPTVIQGSVENSNVNSMEEVVNLTEVNRAYQGAARLMRQIEDLEQRSIRELSRLPN